MTDQVAEIDPFAPGALDQETELAALTHALEFASGFSLLFVVCNQAPQRRQLMTTVRERLPEFTIREIHFNEPVSHLLDELREQLAEPLPNAIFVNGLEHSLPSIANAATTSFVVNLNASRNSFPLSLLHPLVLWVPEYVLTAIAQGAPDFFSIRSGVYSFASSPEERIEFARTLSAGTHWQAASLPAAEKRDRTAAIEQLLAEYEKLPADQRDRRAELRLLHRLGSLFHAQGNYSEALHQARRALKLAEELGDLAEIARSLHRLGNFYHSRGKHDEALRCYEQSLQIKEEINDDNGIALLLHDFGNYHLDRGEYNEAHSRYEQSLRILKRLDNQAGIAISLLGLGRLHQIRSEYAEAMDCYEQSWQIQQDLGDRAGIALSLYNLGLLYQARGEYIEAEDRYARSLMIFSELGDQANVAKSLGQMGKLFTEAERYEDAFPMLLGALAIFIQLQLPEMRIAMSALVTLRVRWGLQAFNAAWREAKGEDVPEWLQESSKTAS